MRAAMSPVRSSAYKKRHGAIKSQIHPEPQAPLQIPPHSDDIPGKNNSPPGAAFRVSRTARIFRIP